MLEAPTWSPATLRIPQPIVQPLKGSTNPSSELSRVYYTLMAQVARLRSLSAAPSVGAEQEVALAPEHRGRLEANHRRRLQELAQRACLNLVKGLMKHHVRTTGPGYSSGGLVQRGPHSGHSARVRKS